MVVVFACSRDGYGGVTPGLVLALRPSLKKLNGPFRGSRRFAARPASLLAAEYLSKVYIKYNNNILVICILFLHAI